ncbi:MAG: hypothetical protein ABII09_02710 [Planctomycetota bacterium]
MNQRQFFNIFLHIIDVPVSNEVAIKKKIHLTAYAHRKCLLWKIGGLSFVIADF